MIGSAPVSQRDAFGEALVVLGNRYSNMVVLDPDVCTSTKTDKFRKAFPDRFFQMGIAEANAVGVAAGMASCGLRPWLSAFAVFVATRALDQIRVSIAHTGLDVKLNGAYGGLPSGRGGATHSSIEDLAVMRAMPGMVVLTPADASEAKAMASLAMEIEGPVYLRTMRCELPALFEEGRRPTLGKATELRAGGDVAILAEGMMSYRAVSAARILEKAGIGARVLHFGTVKPLDREAVAKASAECRLIVTVENHSIVGGLGAAVAEAVADTVPCRVLRLGFPDVFLESGDDEAIFARYGLNAEGIASTALEALEALEAHKAHKARGGVAAGRSEG